MNKSKFLAQLTAAAHLQYIKQTEKQGPVPRRTICIGRSPSAAAVCFAAMASDHFDPSEPQTLQFLAPQLLAVNCTRHCSSQSIGARMIALDGGGHVYTWKSEGKGWLLHDKLDHPLMNWGDQITQVLTGRQPLDIKRFVTTHDVGVGDEEFSLRTTDPVILGLHAVCEQLSSAFKVIDPDDEDKDMLRMAYSTAFTAANFILTQALSGIPTLPDGCIPETLTMNDDVVSGRLAPKTILVSM